MGVTLTAKNSTYSFDMGYGGFFNLQKNIAMALDKEFGEHYAELMRAYYSDKEEYDKKTAEIISRKGLEKKFSSILDFLYTGDCDGKIDYRTCGKIYDLIKDVDFGNKCFRYVAHAHNDYGELKEFLKECYSHRRNAYWR